MLLVILFVTKLLIKRAKGYIWQEAKDNPAGNYMFKVNNRNTRTRCKICSKLTIKISLSVIFLLTLNTFIYLFIYLFIYSFIHLFIYSFIYLFIFNWREKSQPWTQVTVYKSVKRKKQMLARALILSYKLCINILREPVKNHKLKTKLSESINE